MTAPPQPPFIGPAAIVQGPAAAALAKAIDRDAVNAEFVRLGYPEHVRELALASLAAINLAGLAWKRRHRSESGTGSGSAGPQPATVETMSTADAAARLGVSESMVRRLARQGAIEGRLVASRWLIDAASVDAHIQRKAGHQ